MSLRMITEVTQETIKQLVLNILAPVDGNVIRDAIEKDYSFLEKLKEAREKLDSLPQDTRKIVKMMLDTIEIAREIVKSFPPSTIISVLKMKNVLEFLKQEKPDVYEAIVTHPNGKKWLKKRLVEIARYLLNI